jgi:hypothetical protein
LRVYGLGFTGFCFPGFQSAYTAWARDKEEEEEEEEEERSTLALSHAQSKHLLTSAQSWHMTTNANMQPADM